MRSETVSGTATAGVTDMGAAAFALEGVHFAYGAEPVLRDLSFSVAAGEMVGLLGPNGSGKTTVLRLLSGAINADSGAVMFEGRRRGSYSRRELARRLAVVPQELQVTFEFRAGDLVLMGRNPHVNWLRGEREHDRQIARRAMADVGVAELSERPFQELSGGEKQRVVLAMALAQEPSVLLLDEPTNNLDISNQTALFDLIRRLNRERGLTVCAVVHDVNLASLYCDRVILLRDGAVLADGTPQDVITPPLLRRCYGADVHVFPHPVTGRPQIALLPSVEIGAVESMGSGPAG